MKIILDFPYKKIKKKSKKGGAHLHRKKYLKTCHELCDPTSSKETCKRNTVIILQELQKYVYPAINKEKKAIINFKNNNFKFKNNDIIKYIQVAEDILFIVTSLLKLFKNTIK